MKLSQIAVVAAALFGGANAAPGPRAGIRDGDEKGIDCGGGDGQAECNCWTDQTRTFVPPTLLNDDLDRQGQEDTGIVTIGENSFLEVVIDLDSATYVAPITGFAGTGQDTAVSGVGGRTVAGTYLSDATDGFVTDNRYANPRVFFVDHANATPANRNDPINTCEFQVSGTETDMTLTGAKALSITRGDSACTTGFRASLQADLRPTLNNCGFEKSSISTDGSNQIYGQTITAQPGVVGGDYTQYTGVFKIETTRQNGEIRGEENVLKEEYAFTIAVLFPENLTVTSSPVSIIGEASHAAALTHQIYDSANNNLNINALIGTTFPFAITHEDLSAPVKSGDSEGNKASLVLDTSDLSVLPTLVHNQDGADAQMLADWTTYCDAGEADYSVTKAYNNGRVCDKDADGTLTLADLVTIDVAPNAFYDTGAAGTNADGAGFFGADGLGGTDLPEQRCVGENFAVANQNDQACLQNTFFRLKPLPGTCDFNLPLTLTLNAVCRDDFNGDNVNTDSIQSTEWTGSATGVADWPTTSANQLFNSGGSTLDCDSKNYRQTIEAAEVFSFTLASDNFCPRVIATGTLNPPEMSIYESSFGESTWGAHGYADATAAANAVDETAQSSTCTAGEHLVAGKTLCLQVPGYTTESQAPTADQRKLQDEFVFGTTSYIETRIAVASGVNIKQTEITDLWIGRSERTDGTPGTARDLDTEFPVGGNNDVGATNGLWYKQLVDNSAVIPAGDGTPGEPEWTAADGSSTNDITPFVQLSNNIVTNSLIVQSDGSTTNNFFGTSPANPAETGTEAAKLGAEFEGVSRATVEMNKFTVLITDSIGEAAEPIAFYANIAIEYKPANEQGELGQAPKRSVKSHGKIPADAANRARSLAAPSVTGGQASANAGVRASGASGAAGGSSTIAGFSSTTVLAAAAVLGAVVVAAGASFFVVRKRRQAAAKTAKRSSSSTELNDTAQVQV